MFDKIHNKWKEEREKEEITPMIDPFYGSMRDFLQERTKAAKQALNPITKKILEKRLERIQYVINDLIKIRTNKIIKKVINQEEISVNLAREELSFFDRMKQIYDIYRKEIFSPKDVAYTDIQGILGVKEEEPEAEVELVAIRFLKATKQAIQGLDGKIYGPFEPDDVCFLPKENAISFVKQSIAEDIKIDN
jgi:DNA replication initiation complex subunit (GINS family)